MKDFTLKKLYYSISEVSKLTGLEQYILRYWETEFSQLNPGKNRAGNRIYTNKDIKLILQIKKLLRDEKYTIEGAKQILNEGILDNPFENTIVETESNIDLTSPRSLKIDLEDFKNFLIHLKSKL
ncbi:MAG: MerR family transcriptional regulator [Ignavibacteria bacterium]|nr:MerR family transcriptional regulator [Ignavibacteria bacterium]